MIQTERDFVRSLQYIIENYIPELCREDIPQALRGQRNVIFGNIEKIYGFHHHYFLRELERCHNLPFLVGQCFLRHEQHFYLYALYNKNKPKSDALMAEYGTAFFRVTHSFNTFDYVFIFFFSITIEFSSKFAIDSGSRRNWPIRWTCAVIY